MRLEEIETHRVLFICLSILVDVEAVEQRWPKSEQRMRTRRVETDNTTYDSLHVEIYR